MNEHAQFLNHYGLPFLFMVVFVEQLGLPIPALPWLLIAGALSASGQFNLPLGILVTVLACLVSDTIWFGLGRRRGNQVIRFLSRFSLKLKWRVRRADKDLGKRRLFGVLLSKFIPGIGSVAPPLAGMSRINPARFLFVDAIGSFLYAVCWLSVGYVFSPQISRIEAVVARIGLSLFLLIVTVVIVYLVYRHFLRAQMPKREPSRTSIPVTEAFNNGLPALTRSSTNDRLVGDRHLPLLKKSATRSSARREIARTFTSS